MNKVFSSFPYKVIAALLALFALIMGRFGEPTYTCMDLTEGIMSIFSVQSAGSDSGERVFYFGRTGGTESKLWLSKTQFSILFPEHYPQSNDLIRNNDTLYKANVYYLPSGRAYAEWPKDCSTWEDTKLRSNLIYTAMFLPLLAWLVPTVYGRLRAYQSNVTTLVILSVLAATPDSLKAQYVDSTVVFVTEEVVTNLSYTNYPDTILIRKTTDPGSITLDYPEGVLHLLISSTDLNSLNRAFKSDATVMFPSPADYVEAVSSNTSETIAIHPAYKLTFTEPGSATCYLKFSFFHIPSQDHQLAMIKLIQENNRWQISSDPMDYAFSMAIISTRDNILHQIFSGNTDDPKLKEYHELCTASGSFSIDVFAGIYMSWFNGDNQISDEVARRYTTPRR